MILQGEVYAQITHRPNSLQTPDASQGICKFIHQDYAAHSIQCLSDESCLMFSVSTRADKRDVNMSRIEAFTASSVPESPSVWKQVLSLCGLGYLVISWLTLCYCPRQKSVATSLNASTS